MDNDRIQAPTDPERGESGERVQRVQRECVQRECGESAESAARVRVRVHRVCVEESRVCVQTERAERECAYLKLDEQCKTRIEFLITHVYKDKE